MSSFIFRVAVGALFLLCTSAAFGQSSSLWTFTQTEPTVAANAASAADGQQAQQLATLIERLRKTSPNGLASLQWVQLDTQQLAQLTDGQDVRLLSPNGDAIALQMLPRKTNALGITTLSARGNDVMLRISQKGQAVSGTLVIDGERWKLSARGRYGALYKNSDLPSVSDKGIKDDGLEPPDSKKPSTQAQSQSKSAPATEAGNTADVVIVYTTPLLEVYGGRDGVLTRINDVVEATNEIYANSTLDLQINVMDIIEVAYDDDNEIGSETALDALTGFNSDAAYFAHARAQTDRLGADFLIAFRPYVNDGICGIAWLGGGNDSEYNPSLMVSHTSLDCGDEVNAHELGHNMGLSHSRRQNGQGHVYPYALGYGVDSVFTTVMAYPQAFGGASREYKFSSPELTCAESYDCGVDHTDTTNGADSVRALTLRRDQITTIRDAQEVSGELLTVTSGLGSVSVDDQVCESGESCSYTVSRGSTITLTATATSDIEFVEWRGNGCSGAELECEVTINDTTNVIAVFQESYLDIPISQALDNDQLFFITGQSAPWRAQAQEVSVGDSAMRSPIINGNESTYISTVVEGYGEVTFDAKVSSEASYDGLSVYVNGAEIEFISGERGWQSYRVEVRNTGLLFNSIEFVYRKDGTVSAGDDRAWLDNVQYARTGEQPVRVELKVEGMGAVDLLGRFNRCRETCVTGADVGELLTFNAVADSGQQFLGWGGACRGQQTQCQVTVEQAVDAFAYFSKPESTIDYTESLDNAELDFYSAPNSWVVTTDSSTVGGSAAVSADISDGDVSSISTQVYGPGEISFDWRVSSEANWDFLELYIDGALIDEISGETDWQSKTYTLDDDGAHEIVWRYAKDASVSNGDDRGYLDNVQWTGNYITSRSLSVTVDGNHGAVRTNTGLFCRSECDWSLADGETTVIYAEPDPGFNFDGWEGSCSGKAPSCELTVTEDSRVRAVFSKPMFEVTTSVTGGGRLTPESQQVEEGATAILSVSPLAGHTLSSITGCNGTLVNSSEYQTGAVVEDCTVQASFNELLYTVNFDLGDYGYWQDGPDLSQQVRWGEAAQAPNFRVAEGWHFAGWDSDFSRVVAPLTVTANYQQIAGNNRVVLNTENQGRLNIEPVQYVSDGSYLSVTVSPLNGLTLSREVTGSCPEGSWASNTYRFGPINDDCGVNFAFNAARGSGSILMILSAIAAEQAAAEKAAEEEDEDDKND